MILPDEEYLDFSRVPQSRGVPKVLVVSGLVGIVMIFAIGGATIRQAGYSHHWPWTASMRVDLGKLHR